MGGICDRTPPLHCLPMPKLHNGIQQPFSLTGDLGIRCLRRTQLDVPFDIHDISLIARVAGECTVLKDFFADILRQCAPVCVLFLSPSLRASPCGFDFLEHGVFWVDAVLTRQLAFRRLAGYAKVWHSITSSINHCITTSVGDHVLIFIPLT